VVEDLVIYRLTRALPRIAAAPAFALLQCAKLGQLGGSENLSLPLCGIAADPAFAGRRSLSLDARRHSST